MHSNYELAMCGCRCDLCKAYTPNVEKNDQRKALAQMWHKYYGLDPSVMGCCDGCRSNPSDAGCPVRQCVIEKGLRHCGDCGDFPCGIFPQRCGSFPEEAKKEFDMDEYNEYILAYDNQTRLKAYRLGKASEEAMRFLRGRYMLDEVSSGKDEVAFCGGGQTILTIYIRCGYFDFHIGENIIRVSDMKSLEEAKRLIMARKEPNRRPFPKENAVYARCGHRCDLCQHYTGGSNSEAFRAKLIEHVRRIYGGNPDEPIPACLGCNNGGLDGKSDCPQMKCAAEKGLARCQDCKEYDNGCRPWAGHARGIEARSISAEDVTWAVLPYVYNQYGN